MRMRRLTSEDFEPWSGMYVALEAPGGDVPCMLVDVRRVSEDPSRFTVTLRGPRDCALPEGNYRLRHPKLGHLDLFVVPIGEDDTGVRYEIAFG